MEELNFIVCIIAFLVIILICGSVLKKNTKYLKINFSFFNGFEFICSFYKEETKNQQR